MCFHLSLSKTAQQIENRFNAKFFNAKNFSPVFHASGFKYPEHPVVTNHAKEEIGFFNWGLIPSWVKSKEAADEFRAYTLNARTETIFDKPSFRSAIVKRRCLIPASGFFEWQTIGTKKYPYYISLKNQEIFSFAGIWESWEEPSLDGERVNSFSILTTEANELMAKIHNIKKRMPVILPANKEDYWLSPNLKKEEIEKFFTQYPSEEMQAHTISKRITSRSDNPNSAETLEPFVYAELKN